MEYSKNFNFALPSSANDVDLADINEIANNFRKIDENAVKKEVGKGLSTNDFTDADKSKLDGVNGIKYIAESVVAHELDNGIYMIDGVNGGALEVYGIFAVNGYSGSGTFFDGIVIVSNNVGIEGAKSITIIATDDFDYTPTVISAVMDTSGTVDGDSSDMFVKTKYLKEQLAVLQAQIDELKNTSGNGGRQADGTVYRPFVEELENNTEITDYSAELV